MMPTLTYAKNKNLVELLHKELSYTLQGIAFAIRKDFGLGHKEQIYQKAFEEELKRQNIRYDREKSIKIYSPRDGKLIGLYRPDFIIDDKIIVEIKTLVFLPKLEMRKIYDYLRNSEYELGYLINFASPRLYIKRVVFSNSRKDWFRNVFASVSLLFALISGLSLSSEVFAQSLSLKSVKQEYRVGDSFAVSLALNTDGKPINTVSGTIVVPPEFLPIIDVRSGNSIISLWVERPQEDVARGTIAFTGGVPGGFNGSDGPILSFGVRAARVGIATIDLQDFRVLLNDGEGTEVTAGFKPLMIVINEVAALPSPVEPQEVYQPAPDTVPPEPFTPLVSQHPSVADNKFFVSFFAVDKDLGISRYEIREEPLVLSWFTDLFSADWTQGESPFILRNQLWMNRVRVRAYDNANNITESAVVKPFDPMVIWIFVILLIVIIAVLMIYISRLRHENKTRGRSTKSFNSV